MARFRIENYKGYAIYAAATLISGSQDRWQPKGVMFSPLHFTKTIEVHCAEIPLDLLFYSEEAAKQYGLELCKIWVDEQL